MPGIELVQADGRLSLDAPPPSGMEGHSTSALDEQTFYTRTFYATADTTVLQGYHSGVFGSTLDMWAGYDDVLNLDGQIARSLIQFDIASLPSGSSIVTATLRVYLVNSRDWPGIARTITTYRTTSDWSEVTTNWNNSPGYGSAYGTNSIVHLAWGWYEFDVKDLVSAWSDGTYANYGIMLRGPEVSGSDSSWRAFSTREDPGKSPQLVIIYEDAHEYDVYLPVIMRNTSPPSALAIDPIEDALGQRNYTIR